MIVLGDRAFCSVSSGFSIHYYGKNARINNKSLSPSTINVCFMYEKLFNTSLYHLRHKNEDEMMTFMHQDIYQTELIHFPVNISRINTNLSIRTSDPTFNLPRRKCNLLLKINVDIFAGSVETAD